MKRAPDDDRVDHIRQGLKTLYLNGGGIDVRLVRHRVRHCRGYGVVELPDSLPGTGPKSAKDAVILEKRVQALFHATQELTVARNRA